MTAAGRRSPAASSTSRRRSGRAAPPGWRTVSTGRRRAGPRSCRRRPHAAELEREAGVGGRPVTSSRRRSRARRAAGSRGRPEVRVAHPRVGRTSAGVPTAMTSPKSRTWIRSHTSITNAMSCSTSRIDSPSSRTGDGAGFERLGLLVRLTGRGLVEQQHPWLDHQGPSELDHPGDAGRDVAASTSATSVRPISRAPDRLGARR